MVTRTPRRCTASRPVAGDLRPAISQAGLTPRSPEPAFGRDDQAFRIRVKRFGNEPLVDLRTVGVGGSRRAPVRQPVRRERVGVPQGLGGKPAESRTPAVCPQPSQPSEWCVCLASRSFISCAMRAATRLPPAEQRDELAPSHHSITSSARASSVGVPIMIGRAAVFLHADGQSEGRGWDNRPTIPCFVRCCSPLRYSGDWPRAKKQQCNRRSRKRLTARVESPRASQSD